MSRYTTAEDDELPEEPEGPDEDEGPDESDRDRDDADPVSETVPCPWCGEDVYEGAERCPECGKYRSAEDAPSRKPLWVIATVIVCVVVITVVWLLSFH